MSRCAILVLLIWKAWTAVTLAPEGRCVRFEPTRPIVADATSAVPHSWDVRADWRNPQPACSAVMRRAYTGIGEFPVWFFNLPPTTDALHPSEDDRPPAARTMMVVTGYLEAPAHGEIGIDVGDDMKGHTRIHLDGDPIADVAQVTADSPDTPGRDADRRRVALRADMERRRPLVVARAGDAQAALARRSLDTPCRTRVDHRRRARVDRRVDSVVSVGDPLADGISWLVGVSVYFAALIATTSGGLRSGASPVGSRWRCFRCRRVPETSQARPRSSRFRG